MNNQLYKLYEIRGMLDALMFTAHTTPLSDCLERI